AGWKINSRDKLLREQAICRYINGLDEAGLAAIKQYQVPYTAALSKYGLEDKTMAGPANRVSVWKRLLLLVGWPLYAVGLLLNGLPVFIARRIVDKKVYRKDFYTWIFVTCYSLLYFFWMLLLLLAAGWYGWQYAIALAAAMILTGLFSYQYTGWQQEARQQLKLQQLSVQEVNELKVLRSIISPS
ncbi:MAG TPA: hypothetical protein VLD19_15260, partial [Chitinophagaceae bacterium]|nr:hypothetical protein [Chitinophagaceae bacterium]